MKKVFTLILFLILVKGVEVQSQNFLNENFGSGTFPPTGWTISSHPSNWLVSNSTNAGGTAPELVFRWNPAFVGVSRFVSPSLDLSANDAGQINISFKHMVDYYAGTFEIGLAYSEKGGEWQTIWNLNPTASITAGTVTLVLDSDEFPVASNDVKIAFFFNGNSFNINFWFIDDVSVSSFSTDLAVSSVDVQAFIFNPVPVSGTVTNFGFDAITSFDLNWQMNDGPLQTQSFTDIALEIGESYPFETTELLWGDAGTYNLNVYISDVNGLEEDENPANDTITRTVRIFDPEQITYRPLFESFSSSTCPPCAPFNTNVMNPFVDLYKEHLTIIKYQMNWPGSGDPYYTAEGGARRTFYGINTVPSLITDGSLVPTNAPSVNNAFVAGLNRTAQMHINGFHYLEGTTINVLANVHPLVSLENVRLHVVVVENTTYNNATVNGETEFHYVMMKMLPNAQGTTIDLQEGIAFSASFSADLTNTNIEDFDNLSVVLFVQNHSNRFVYQSAYTEYSEFLFVDFDLDPQQTGIEPDATVSVSFTKPVNNLDETEITNENVSDLITFQKVTRDMADVPFVASISNDKMEIEISPEELLEFNTQYFIEIASVKGSGGFVTEPRQIVFTTRASAGAPVADFSLEDGSTGVPLNPSVEILLNQHVRHTDGSEITDASLPSLVMFYENDANGEPVAFVATINEERTLITVTPSDVLLYDQLYMLGIDHLLGVDNEISDPEHITFVTEEDESLNTDLSESPAFSVYPNPATERLMVNLPEELSGATIRIFNVAGQMAMSSRISGHQTLLDISHLAAGLYTLEISGNGYSAIRRIVVSK